MIIDTDVLIWYMKGNEKAFELIGSPNGFFVSVVSYIELIHGMRNKIELQVLRKTFLEWNTKISYINAVTSG